MRHKISSYGVLRRKPLVLLTLSSLDGRHLDVRVWRNAFVIDVVDSYSITVWRLHLATPIFLRVSWFYVVCRVWYWLMHDADSYSISQSRGCEWAGRGFRNLVLDSSSLLLAAGSSSRKLFSEAEQISGKRLRQTESMRDGPGPTRGPWLKPLIYADLGCPGVSGVVYHKKM